MKRYIVAFLGMFFWFPQFTTAQEQLQSSVLEIKRDRFTGTITLKGANPPTSTGVVDVTPLGTVTAGAAEVNFNLLILAKHQRWKYLECHDARWLIDGQQLSLPAVSHKGRVGDGYVLEFLVIASIPLEALDRMATAQLIEFKICNDEFKLGPNRLIEIRELAKLMPVAISEARASASP